MWHSVGWMLVAFGIILAALETYRTSRFAHPILAGANKYLGPKVVIWRPIALVVTGVLVSVIRW
jgi:uncharacterized membrane protein YidH (DUF202 family)